MKNTKIMLPVQKTSIKYWSEDDRPREKLRSKGSESLSNSELIAILLHSGTRYKSAIELAKEIMLLGSNNLNELGKLSIKELMKVKGIGNAKAITIAAAMTSSAIASCRMLSSMGGNNKATRMAGAMTPTPIRMP